MRNLLIMGMASLTLLMPRFRVSASEKICHAFQVDNIDDTNIEQLKDTFMEILTDKGIVDEETPQPLNIQIYGVNTTDRVIIVCAEVFPISEEGVKSAMLSNLDQEATSGIYFIGKVFEKAYDKFVEWIRSQIPDPVAIIHP